MTNWPDVAHSAVCLVFVLLVIYGDDIVRAWRDRK